MCPASPPCRQTDRRCAWRHNTARSRAHKIQFTASREAYDMLRRAQSLLRHVIPNGDPAAVFERALDALLADLERKKLAATGRPYQAKPPTPGSGIPAAVRREVWRRDGARCAFVGATGRCAERGFLELHHVVPFAKGGEATTANIELRCRSHNAYEAELSFGSFVLREHQADYNPVRTESDIGTTSVPLDYIRLVSSDSRGARPKADGRSPSDDRMDPPGGPGATHSLDHDFAHLRQWPWRTTYRSATVRIIRLAAQVRLKPRAPETRRRPRTRRRRWIAATPPSPAGFSTRNTSMLRRRLGNSTARGHSDRQHGCDRT